MPATSPSTVLFGDRSGASLCWPQSRPPRYAAVSPRKVATSTSIIRPSPCGSSRRNTAWASGRPIHAIPKIVAAIPQAMLSMRARASARMKTSGNAATSAIRTEARSS